MMLPRFSFFAATCFYCSAILVEHICQRCVYEDSNHYITEAHDRKTWLCKGKYSISYLNPFGSFLCKKRAELCINHKAAILTMIEICELPTMATVAIYKRHRLITFLTNHGRTSAIG